MKIGAYVRVPSQYQAQSQTIEHQLERLRAHFEYQNWPWNEENVFRDDGFSGASLKRPGLDRLRDKVALASFERVVITAPDRLSRKYVHQMLLIEEFEKAGCQLEFIEGQHSEAVNDFTIATEKNSNLPEYHFERSKSYSVLGNSVAAKKDNIKVSQLKIR